MSKGPHGWIILNKPPGLGSTQAVSAVKRNLRDAGLLGKLRDGPKVGHGGTLDPLAEGVLPIALGEATKLTGRLLEADKIYAFTLAFGVETDGLDAEGEVVARSDHRPPLASLPLASYLRWYAGLPAEARDQGPLLLMVAILSASWGVTSGPMPMAHRSQW